MGIGFVHAEVDYRIFELPPVRSVNNNRIILSRSRSAAAIVSSFVGDAERNEQADSIVRCALTRQLRLRYDDHVDSRVRVDETPPFLARHHNSAREQTL